MQWFKLLVPTIHIFVYIGYVSKKQIHENGKYEECTVHEKIYGCFLVPEGPPTLQNQSRTPPRETALNKKHAPRTSQTCAWIYPRPPAQAKRVRNGKAQQSMFDNVWTKLFINIYCMKATKNQQTNTTLQKCRVRPKKVNNPLPIVSNLCCFTGVSRQTQT